MLKFLDIFFVFFHTSLILFNLFGWIWKKTRKANLITLLLTGASWFVLGIFYGIGYCPLTDWHWDILRKLGHYDIPNSYIQYLFIRLIHIEFDAQLVDYATAGGYFLALIISLYINGYKWFKKVFSKMILFLLFFIMISCAEDFDVIADKEDVPVVYCILDVNDSVHYARITKSFVGETSVSSLMENPSNLYFDEIQVYIEEYTGNQKTNSYQLVLDTTIIKEDGLFPIQNNVNYTFEAFLDPESKYVLKIILPGNDTVKAETFLLHQLKVNPVSSIYYSADNPYELRWTSAINGKYYEVFLAFYLAIRTGYEIEYQTINYKVGDMYSIRTDGSERLLMEITGAPFQYIEAEYLNDTINPGVLLQVDLILAGATEEYMIYINSAENQGTGIQERPVFNNIQGGRGIFTSRYIKIFEDVDIIEY